MKHLLIDADSIAYAGAYKEDPVQIYSHIDSTIQDIWSTFSGICASAGDTPATKMYIYVETWEQKHNFRKWLAVSQPYKAKRTKTIPLHCIKEAKKHLVGKWGAEAVKHAESEDYCLIGANAVGYDNAVVAAIDKDVYQAPTTYINYNTGEVVTLSHEEAELRLWRQILTGDSTDSIPGLEGIGPKRAETALDGVPVECYSNHVAHIYKELGHSYGYFIEQCRLIYLLREPAEVWLPITSEEWSEL